MDAYKGEKRKREQTDTSGSDRRHQSSARPAPSHSKSKAWASSDQARLNHIQEEERHREFLAKEGQFVLQQKRKAAEIRIKEGRAQPIDWLTVNLRILDPVEDLINDEVQDSDLDYIDPEGVINGLSAIQLKDVRKEIDEFLDLENSRSNRDYWRTMRILCGDRQKGIDSRAVRSVSTDIDKLLAPKTYEDLEKLEKQINKKLDSDEPIDTDYWQQLLDSLLVYKAKAKLKILYRTVLDGKLATLKLVNIKAAEHALNNLSKQKLPNFAHSKAFDPDPQLQRNSQDKSLPLVDEEKFLNDLSTDRQRISKIGYIPSTKKTGSAKQSKETERYGSGANGEESSSKPSSSFYDREVAKGVEEDEEIFAGEEAVETKNRETWKNTYRPRKPKYFNRVQMGYEWNKYNQTHYDHDNPPPKVVQGYKFHIFYPDLIERHKAPTYKITREGGRKKGETVAPAGEEDTCIIRFIAGPPYEDVAFRIVDRDWDYSARHDRGFKSTFDNGILTLHFSFKKIFYRK